MNIDETIVAPATGAGEAALAIIRVSGPLVPDLVRSTLKTGLTGPIPRKAVLSKYSSKEGRVLDHLIYTYYTEGNSFTGEHLLELNCHGNPFIIRKLMDDLVSRGCRLADPGEFTRRSFLNGNMDLTQAEAVSDIIRARSDRALEAARRQLCGSIGTEINNYVSRLLHITAQLEAYIDFPEEDLPPEDQEGPAKEISLLSIDIQRLISTSKYSSLLHQGVKCVILGEPNAGKSSLLNAMIGDDRAIVSAEPGTTRDYVEDSIHIGPYLLRVIDTAGLHETDNSIEQQGISRSLQQMASADIILLVLDSSKEPPTLPPEVVDALDTLPSIVVENKTDLMINPAFQHFHPKSRHVQVSASKGIHIDNLRNILKEEIEKGIMIPDDQAVIISARHADALKQAKVSLDAANDKFKMSEPAELIASDLHMCIEAMGYITGKIDNEQMLDALFQSFCIGK